MPFSNFPTSPFEIFSPDGASKCQSKGIFGDDGVTVFDTKVDVEPGDFLQRTLSNGKTETYTVRDAIFQEKFHAIPAHYSLKVIRQGSIPRPSGAQTVNISGPNARFNLHSTDNSTNTLVQGSVFGDLLATINAGVADAQEREVLVGAVERLAAATTKGDKLDAYQKLIAVAANHMTLLAPFLGQIGAMLS